MNNELLSKFLSETDGITMTSATHLCNVAGEKADEILEKYQNLGFVNVTAKAAGSSDDIIISMGMESDQLEDIAPDLEEVSKLHALIAWLREAVKVKNNQLTLLREHKRSASQMLIKMKYLDKKVLTEDCPEDPKLPEMWDEDSTESKMKFLTTKELNEYFTLNSKSAVIGNYIHPNKPFQKFRKELRNSISNPTTLREQNGTLVAVTSIPSLDKEILESKFYELQKVHRSTEARLNTLRQKVRTACQEANDALTIEFRKKRDEYSEYDNKLTEMAQKAIETEYIRVSNLKIIIPNDLKDIFEKINNL